MPLSLIYWILMLLWLVGGVYVGFRPGGDRFVGGGSILLFLLLALLGFAVFGSPIKGG
jgi:hypothetical protein